MIKKILAALFAMSMSLSATADVVYDNGAPTTRNGYSINHSSWVADDFTIAAGAKVHSVGFYFQNYYGITGWDNKVSYRFLTDNANTPGTVLASGAGQNVTASESIYDWCCGGKAWLVNFDLVNDFQATAGQKYWLELSGAGGNSAWWVTASNGNASVSGYRPGVDFAFTLASASVPTPAPVPEPGSIALLGLGLMAAVGARRRKLSK